MRAHLNCHKMSTLSFGRFESIQMPAVSRFQRFHVTDWFMMPILMIINQKTVASFWIVWAAFWNLRFIAPPLPPPRASCGRNHLMDVGIIKIVILFRFENPLLESKHTKRIPLFYRPLFYSTFQSRVEQAIKITEKYFSFNWTDEWLKRHCSVRLNGFDDDFNSNSIDQW